MNKQSVIDGLSKISAVMTENKEYLIKLDQQNGDGDLGVSMSEQVVAELALPVAGLMSTESAESVAAKMQALNDAL